jgi:peroxiredoxin
MANLHKKLELVANISIIVVAVLVGGLLVDRYLIRPSPKPEIRDVRVKPGTKLTLTGVDWDKSNPTLLLVLSTDCRFCTESASFYQRLVLEKAKHGRGTVIAVLPQTVEVAKKYLDELSVTVDDIRQATPVSVGARATPTIVLVDRTGAVVESWVGKLPSEQESAVFNRFFANAPAG